MTCVVSTVGLQLVLRILPVLGNAVTYSVEDAAILVISVALSVILFKEKLTPVKTVGIVLALISVLMLTCGDHVLAPYQCLIQFSCKIFLYRESVRRSGTDVSIF